MRLQLAFMVAEGFGLEWHGMAWRFVICGQSKRLLVSDWLSECTYS